MAQHSLSSAAPNRRRRRRTSSALAAGLLASGLLALCLVAAGGRTGLADPLPPPGSSAVADEDKADDEANKHVLDRLDALEQNHTTLQADFDDLSDDYAAVSKNYADLKQKLKSAAFSGHRGATMSVNGRIHADLWNFPGDSPGVNAFENNDPTISPQDRIGFRRIRFGVKGKARDLMLYRIEMEFAGGDESEFRDVYIGWEDLPVLQRLLIGNQKRPYGLDHLNSSRYNVFLERPFVIESFNQDARRWGIQANGVSNDQAWNWRYGAFNQRLIQDEGNYVSDHFQMEVAGRLANTFWYDESSDGRGYGHWAVSGSAANPDGSGIPGRAVNEAQFRHRPEGRSVNRWLDTGQIAGADDYQLVGLENVWNFGPLQIVGEYQNLWLQRREAPEVHLHGGYVYLSYFLTGEHMPWKRSEGVLDRIVPLENFFLVDTCCEGVKAGWGAWQAAYRYSYADFTNAGITGGVGSSHTLGLNWYWTPYARLQFNAIYGEIEQRGPIAGQTFGNYTILGTRLNIDF